MREPQFHKFNFIIIFKKIKNPIRDRKTARKSLQFTLIHLEPCLRNLLDVDVEGYQRFDQVFRLLGTRHLQ